MASYIANDMRVGWVISHNGKRYSVTSITKVKPGKGGAFVQADLRDIDSGNKGGDRWRAEDKVEKLKPVYKKDKVTMNYDITIVLLALGIIVMLGFMLFAK